MPIEQFDFVLLVGAGGRPVRHRCRPAVHANRVAGLLLYLGLGLLLGEDAIGIYFNDDALARCSGSVRSSSSWPRAG